MLRAVLILSSSKNSASLSTACHIESKKFPLLQKKGSGCFYYSQAEVLEVVEYARERGIRVVPEFDMPCHTASWFIGYPELSSGQGPLKSSAIDPTRGTWVVTLRPDAPGHAPAARRVKRTSRQRGCGVWR